MSVYLSVVGWMMRYITSYIPDTDFIDDFVDDYPEAEREVRKTEKLKLRDDLRDTPSYLLACEAIKGIDVFQPCFHLLLRMSSLFDVRCAIAALDHELCVMRREYGLVENLETLLPCIRFKYKTMVNTVNAYQLAIDDFDFENKLRKRYA